MSESAFHSIGVRPDTRRKFEITSKIKRWTKAETADAAIDSLMEKEGISLPLEGVSTPVPAHTKSP
jgi:hypothetical protein